jgi:hypothetical protein
MSRVLSGRGGNVRHVGDPLGVLHVIEDVYGGLMPGGTSVLRASRIGIRAACTVLQAWAGSYDGPSRKESRVAFIEEARRLVEVLGCQLKPVPQSTVDSLRREFPELPVPYSNFLLNVGAGGIRGRFQVYESPMDPDEVYDPETAEGLEGVILFGDDYRGSQHIADTSVEGLRALGAD